MRKDKKYSQKLTCRPASLLCLFNKARASLTTSLASRKPRENLVPNSMLSLQRSHIKPLPYIPPELLSHEHSSPKSPRLHDLVTSCTTPADDIAWKKADSRLAAKYKHNNLNPTYFLEVVTVDYS